MKTKTLKQRILTAFAGIIVILGVCILALGASVLKKEIFSRTQRQVERSLDSARTFYLDEIDRIGFSLETADFDASTDTLKEKLKVDYLYRLSIKQAMTDRSEIVRKAAAERRSLGGTRIISKDQQADIGIVIPSGDQIRILDTPKARPSDRTLLESVMAKEFVQLVWDHQGDPVEIICAGRIVNRDSVFCAGRIVNRDSVLVDRIRKLVFGDALYNDKPVGTVTIFQGDVRVSTNVLDADGKRAIGTRVSEEVYHEVVENG
ncbi:MAG: cache domain-containing protein, partial [Planctomycetota bacterium]